MLLSIKLVRYRLPEYKSVLTHHPVQARQVVDNNPCRPKIFFDVTTFVLTNWSGMKVHSILLILLNLLEVFSGDRHELQIFSLSSALDIKFILCILLFDQLCFLSLYFWLLNAGCRRSRNKHNYKSPKHAGLMMLWSRNCLVLLGFGSTDEAPKQSGISCD